MNFFVHEIRALKKAFPEEEATLKEDFQQFELDIVNNLGVLKHQPHLYLG